MSAKVSSYFPWTIFRLRQFLECSVEIRIRYNFTVCWLYGHVESRIAADAYVVYVYHLTKKVGKDGLPDCW